MIIDPRLIWEIYLKEKQFFFDCFPNLFIIRSISILANWTYRCETLFQDLCVVDMSQFCRFPASHLLHLFPRENMLRPPARLHI